MDNSTRLKMQEHIRKAEAGLDTLRKELTDARTANLDPARLKPIEDRYMEMSSRVRLMRSVYGVK